MTPKLKKIRYEVTIAAEARIVLARVNEEIKSTVANGGFVTEAQRDRLADARRHWNMAIEGALINVGEDESSITLLLSIAPPSEIVRAAKRIALGRAVGMIAADPET